MIERLNHLWDTTAAARRRGQTAYLRALREISDEAIALGDKLAVTPVKTMLGLHAKAAYALRDTDPDAPCGGANAFHMADSALFDAMRMGAFSTEDAA